MGVITHTMADYTSPIAPARLFKAFCLDNHNFLPKALPQFVKSVDVEGDSNAIECIKQINFPQGAPYKYAKRKIDEFDTSKYYIKYTTYEGDVLGDTVEKAVYETKFEPTGDGGSHHTMVVHLHMKGDCVYSEEKIAGGKASIKKMFNAAEKYLTANPQLYA